MESQARSRHNRWPRSRVKRPFPDSLKSAPSFQYQLRVERQALAADLHAV
jgi:hypothetical protein